MRMNERETERGRDIRTWPDTRGKCAAGKSQKLGNKLQLRRLRERDRGRKIGRGECSEWAEATAMGYSSAKSFSGH